MVFVRPGVMCGRLLASITINPIWSRTEENPWTPSRSWGHIRHQVNVARVLSAGSSGGGGGPSPQRSRPSSSPQRTRGSAAGAPAGRGGGDASASASAAARSRTPPRGQQMRDPPALLRATGLAKVAASKLATDSRERGADTERPPPPLPRARTRSDDARQVKQRAREWESQP
jgi:hypothetical protein